MHLEALDARLNPIPAALVGAGVDVGDALVVVDEFREDFARALSDGSRKVDVARAPATPMEKFRRALGLT